MAAKKLFDHLNAITAEQDPNYFDKLSEDFEIQGKLKNELLRFKKGVNFDAFIIQLKNK